MLQQQQILEWQRKMAEDDRSWRERQAERDRQWRKEDRHTGVVELAIGALVGSIGTVATLIAASRLAWFN